MTESITRHLETAQRCVHDAAQALSRDAGIPATQAFALLRERLLTWLRADGRSSQWRIRIRIYDAKRVDGEPVADSDPDLPADRPGETVLSGLPGVANELAALAAIYHATRNERTSGLDEETLRHRLKSLRPTLSRRQGNAVWRVPYSTPDRDWLARVDIIREGD